MNLYLITQNEVRGYDTYDSAVVAAETEEAAKALHPDGDQTWSEGAWRFADGRPYDAGDWSSPIDVTADFLGATHKPAGVICASFNAG